MAFASLIIRQDIYDGPEGGVILPPGAQGLIRDIILPPI
jgi:hypothetical protein